MPRAFVASSVEVLPTSAERLARLGAPDYDPLVALLDEAPPLALENGPGAAGTVALERYEPRVVELDADMQRAGLLVISDAWDPGWRVLVDGVEHPALRVNHALRGVALEAGEHTVEWRYEPRSLRLGLALAGLAWLALFLGLVRERRSHKQS